MKQKGINLLALAFAFLVGLPFSRSSIAQSAETSAPSVAVYLLENAGADDSTARVVSDLVFSFIREMRDYSLDFIPSTRAEAAAAGSAAAEDAAHDFIFYGKLIAKNDGITLELFLEGKNPLNDSAIARDYENQNKLMLGTRLLVRELFESSAAASVAGAARAPLSQKAEEAASALDGDETAQVAQQDEEAGFDAASLHLNDVASIDSLAGSWNGERGIEKIMILRGGRGAAVFSSGFSLMISLSIEAGELVVVQKGRSSPLQFVDLPDPVAEKAAMQAPPIVWHFRISDDGNILAGLKSTVDVAHDGQNILSITEKQEQVAWVRN